MCGDGAFGVVTFLEAPHLETHFDWWRSAGGVALCIAVAVVRLFRTVREVLRAHGGVASGWGARCGGDLNVDWAVVVLSEQSQVYEPVAEE
jgi:hypothetical protein